MKIKKLSIQGFKSFMERLEIPFPNGISGFVGPNGCGKSNIVDAIRWCMGEQSPRQLRGRRMEDVIFSGAGDQKALGMAEVCIVLENGEGLFPPAFSQDPEISVTRRLYRSGESEYRINNVACRLKDVQEIFMDTGLGNRAYSIIGQGKIGDILEQRPEDTRIMLEEAAGITKYRKRVEASQKKIELTHTNLKRIEDILTEVQSQMRSLKRQAAKAKRYKGISAEIQELELILNSNLYHQLREESANKLRSSEELVQQELIKSTELSRLHASLETLGLELEEKDNHLEGLRRDHFHLKDRVHKKEAGLEALKGELGMLEEMEVRLKRDQEGTRDKLIGLKEERTRLEVDIEKAKEKARVLEGESLVKKDRLRSKRDLLKSVREEYENARKKLGDGLNEEISLGHEQGYLNKMINQITDSRSRLEKEILEIGARMEEVTKASERKSLAREATLERFREIETLIEVHHLKLQELEQRKEAIEQDLKTAEADLTKCQSRLGSLKTLTESFEGYKMGVRSIMKAKDLPTYQQGRILGLVAEVIQVNPEYEQAVEAVLADKLQYVIVESQDDGIQAIGYLKQNQKGRSSFAPLKELNGNGKRHIHDAAFRLLQDLVTVSPKYRPVLNALLNGAVLVKDLDEAIDAWKRLGDLPNRNGDNFCFVTVDGDMVDSSGVVSGGKSSQGSAGLLVRRREIIELEQRTGKYQKEVDEFRSQLEDVSKEFQETKGELNELTEGKWACQEEINNFDKAVFRLGQELDQLDQLSQRIQKDLEAKSREHDRHRATLLKAEEKLGLRKEMQRREEEYFRKKELELTECEREFEQFREEVTNLESDYRILMEEQRSLFREMQRLDEYADDCEKQSQNIKEEIFSGQTRREQCIKRQEVIREELRDLYERLQRAEDAVNSADLERQEFHSAIKGEEHKVDELRSEIDKLKDKINTAKMEHSELTFKMDGIVQTVKEKSNLSLPNIYSQYVAEDFSQRDVQEKLAYQKDLRENMGEVNLTAIKEHDALKERYEFLKDQREDLIKSIESIRLAIRKINRTSLEKFTQTFQEVDQKIKEIFPILFNGGTAGLKLTDETRPLESGVLVEVQPPGKRLSHMGLLSGGEKALVAMALLFAIYLIKPSPFCLLDEVDAPLDEANIDRFNDLLKEIKKSSQILMVTHSRRTMEIVDRLYGITMEKVGISNVVSVDIGALRSKVVESPTENSPVFH